MAEQTFALQSGWFIRDAARMGYFPPNNSRPLINNDLRGSTGWRVGGFQVTPAGQFELYIAQASEAASETGHDLTTAFETSGSVTVTVGSDTLTVNLGGADTAEPYIWTPSNSAEVTGFYNGVTTAAAGTLTIRDFELSAPSFADDTGDAISATVGQAIADVVVPAATGTPAPTYAAVGNLPAGVTFAPATRTLSFDEDAIEAGSSTITIRATNSEGTDDWTVSYDIRPPIKYQSQNVSGFRYGSATPSAIYYGSTRVF